jgi:hypothetical protein
MFSMLIFIICAYAQKNLLIAGLKKCYEDIQKSSLDFNSVSFIKN